MSVSPKCQSARGHRRTKVVGLSHGGEPLEFSAGVAGAGRVLLRVPVAGTTGVDGGFVFVHQPHHQFLVFVYHPPVGALEFLVLCVCVCVCVGKWVFTSIVGPGALNTNEYH